jgi:hypothetical protein
VGGVLLVWWVTHREPTYEGRTTEQWLQVLHEPLPANASLWVTQEAQAHRAQAEAALRALGTNALPTLLKKLLADDSALALRVAALCRRLGIDPKGRVLHRERVLREHEQAYLGFAALGPIARPAMPELLKWLDQPELAWRAYESLAQFDTNPVPWLLKVATNANLSSLVRADAMFALGNRQHVNDHILATLLAGAQDANSSVRVEAARGLWRFPDQADRIVPVLASLLNDPSISMFAAVSLGEFGTKASFVVPALLKDVESKGPHSAGGVALQRIAPELAARAGVTNWNSMRTSVDTNQMRPRRTPLMPTEQKSAPSPLVLNQTN